MIRHDNKLKNCYVFDISTNKLTRKADMNVGRNGHGLIKFEEKLYAFGGHDGN